MTGTPTAAARCMGPESLPMNKTERRNKAQAWRNDVFPDMSITLFSSA
jgi:hypothetical protein